MGSGIISFLAPIAIISAYNYGAVRIGFIIELILGLNPLINPGSIIVKGIYRGKIAIWSGDPNKYGMMTMQGHLAYIIIGVVNLILYPILIFRCLKKKTNV
jgi:hypothetical protein